MCGGEPGVAYLGPRTSLVGLARDAATPGTHRRWPGSTTLTWDQRRWQRQEIAGGADVDVDVGERHPVTGSGCGRVRARARRRLLSQTRWQASCPSHQSRPGTSANMCAGSLKLVCSSCADKARTVRKAKASRRVLAVEWPSLLAIQRYHSCVRRLTGAVNAPPRVPNMPGQATVWVSSKNVDWSTKSTPDVGSSSGHPDQFCDLSLDVSCVYCSSGRVASRSSRYLIDAKAFVLFLFPAPGSWDLSFPPLPTRKLSWSRRSDRA